MSLDQDRMMTPGSSHGPFLGSNPKDREAAGIMNSLYRRRELGPRVEGLMWILGRREVWALHQVECGSSYVELNPQTGDVTLFGVPVFKCLRESAILLVKEVEFEAR